MLYVVLHLPTDTGLSVGSLAVGYTSYQMAIYILAGKIIASSCMAGSKFAYQIGNRTCTAEAVQVSPLHTAILAVLYELGL